MRSGTSASGLGQVKLPPLEPGASIVVMVSVTAPAQPGPYVLELEVYDDVLGSSGNRFPMVFSIPAN